MSSTRNAFFLPLMLFISSIALTVEAGQTEDADAIAQANNPLARMRAFNLHNYYIGDLAESDDSANQFWLRYAQPFTVGKTNWLMRASLPVNQYPVPPTGTKETGVGDFNIFASYLFNTAKTDVSFGLGPLLTIPTATKEALGNEKWSIGLANVLFNAESKVIQYGYLLTWQHSFAGNDERETVNIAAFQPFAIMQLGGGTYLRTTPIWVYNIENDNYSVPLGIGLGQIIQRGDTVYNLFIEPQFSVADRGAGQPEWQVFIGLNMQFTK